MAGGFPSVANSDLCSMLGGGQHAWLELILWTCASGWWRLLRAARTSGGLSRVRCQRGERREVDATHERNRQRGCQPHGRQAPVPFGGGARLAAARLDVKPDLTLHALRDELRERGVAVSCDTLWRFLKRQEISFKKNLVRRRAGPSRRCKARLRWKKYQARIDPSRLVFIDETWAKTNMTRTRGWRRRGKPLVAKVPHGRWKTLTFSPRCAMTQSPRLSCWTAPSTARPSLPM